MKQIKWLPIILLATLIISSKEVKADSYSKTSINNAVCASGYNCNSFNRNYIYYTFLQKNVISTENFRMNFDAINLVPYDGFKITTIMSEYNQEYFEIYNEYPSAFTWTGSIPESYTITYADGTQAQVRGGVEIDGWQQTDASSTNYNYGTINDTTFAYQLNYISGDNTNNACIMESANNNQITWNCPKTSSASEFNLTGLVLNVRYRTDADMTLYINRTDILLYRNDGSRIITKIEQSTQSIIDAINNGNTVTQNAINNNTQEQQETNDKINEIQNQDISSNDKQSLDKSSYDNYKQKEDQLLNSTQIDNIENSVDIAMDLNSSNFIWQAIERFINTNSKIFTYFISILSIGIIKLILAR